MAVVSIMCSLAILPFRASAALSRCGLGYAGAALAVRRVCLNRGECQPRPAVPSHLVGILRRRSQGAREIDMPKRSARSCSALGLSAWPSILALLDALPTAMFHDWQASAEAPAKTLVGHAARRRMLRGSAPRGAFGLSAGGASGLAPPKRRQHFFCTNAGRLVPRRRPRLGRLAAW